MTHQQPINGDEIDLFDLIEVVWHGKAILVGFLAVALAVGGLFTSVKESQYVTSARYYVGLLPPFVEPEEIQSFISETLYDADTFARWKKGRPGTSLNLDLIDQKRMIDGVSFGTPMEGRFVSLSDTHIKIKSNDHELIFDVLDYFEFVSLVLSERYVSEAERERSRFEKLVKQVSTLSARDSLSNLKEFADIERYLDKASEGAQTIRVTRPLPPQTIGISTRLILAISLIIGGTSGVIFLLIRQSYRARKVRLSGQEA